MSTASRSFGTTALVAISIFGLASCLRPAITAIGPLLPDINATTGLSYGSLGLLGSLPLLLFAVVAPFAAIALRYGGPAAVARWMALTLVVGIVVRSVAASRDCGSARSCWPGPSRSATCWSRCWSGATTPATPRSPPAQMPW